MMNKTIKKSLALLIGVVITVATVTSVGAEIIAQVSVVIKDNHVSGAIRCLESEIPVGDEVSVRSKEFRENLSLAREFAASTRDKGCEGSS